MSCSKDAVLVEIYGWAGDGCGVGRLPDGKAVFVAQALPGELVSARITKEKKSCAWASLEQVLKAAPGRAEAPCPWYQSCGGCCLQHMDVPTQLLYKQGQVEQALHRIGKLDVEVQPCLGAESPWGYRNRVVFHVQHDPALRFGLYQEKSRRLGPADCALLREPLRGLARTLSRELPAWGEALFGLRELALRCDHSGEKMLLSLVADAPLPKGEALAARLMALEPRLCSVWENSGPPVYSVYGGNWRHLAGAKALPDRLAGVELELAPAAFLQVNHAQAERLYGLVRDFLGPMQGKCLLDVYSGVGSIGLSLAKEVGQLISVESYSPSVEAAKRNAAHNGVENVRFLAGTAEALLPKLAAEGLAVDGLVLDPPRAGCQREALDAIARLAPWRIVYVSCDPATLARDLAILAAAAYQVERVQPIDLFSQTGHVETVVLLSKGEVDSKKIRVEFSLEDMDMSEFQDGATYPQIKEYVLEHTGLKVSNLYISQIKRKCGIEVGKNYNLPKSEDSRQPQCPQEKEKAIREAFKYFGMI